MSREIEIINHEAEGSERNVLAHLRSRETDVVSLNVVKPGRSLRLSLDAASTLVVSLEQKTREAVIDIADASEIVEDVEEVEQEAEAEAEAEDSLTDGDPESEQPLEPIDGLSDIEAGKPYEGSVVG